MVSICDSIHFSPTDNCHGVCLFHRVQISKRRPEATVAITKRKTSNGYDKSTLSS